MSTKALQGSAPHKYPSKASSKCSSNPSKSTSEALANYLDDTTHTNPGYSSSYTNALINNYGFPQNNIAISELKDEIVVEAEARVRREIDVYNEQVQASKEGKK